MQKLQSAIKVISWRFGMYSGTQVRFRWGEEAPTKHDVIVLLILDKTQKDQEHI